jgi:hypothetical protein
MGLLRMVRRREMENRDISGDSSRRSATGGRVPGGEPAIAEGCDPAAGGVEGSGGGMGGLVRDAGVGDITSWHGGPRESYRRRVTLHARWP